MCFDGTWALSGTQIYKRGEKPLLFPPPRLSDERAQRKLFRSAPGLAWHSRGGEPYSEDDGVPSRGGSGKEQVTAVTASCALWVGFLQLEDFFSVLFIDYCLLTSVRPHQLGSGGIINQDSWINKERSPSQGFEIPNYLWTPIKNSRGWKYVWRAHHLSASLRGKESV